MNAAERTANLEESAADINQINTQRTPNFKLDNCYEKKNYIL